MVLLIWLHSLAEHLNNPDPHATSERTEVERVVLDADALRQREMRFIDVKPLAGAYPPAAVITWDQVVEECMGKIATAIVVLDEAIDQEIALLAPPAERSGDQICLVGTMCAEIEVTHMSKLRRALSGHTMLLGYKGKDWLVKYAEMSVHKKVSTLAGARGIIIPDPASYAEEKLTYGASRIEMPAKT